MAAAGRRFRPSLPLTLASLSVLLILLGLGTWQLQRLGWKEALIAERQARLAAPPAALTAVERGDIAALAHRRVRLAGRFLHDKTLHFGLRAVGGVPGLELLTPLRLADGAIVMVNRGWVPERLAAQGRKPAGEVEVVGMLRPPVPEPGLFTPENDVAGNRWYFYDIAAMSRHLGLPLLPAVVEAAAAPGDRELPIGRPPTVELANNHLQYAITWYALALALAAIFVLYHWRPGSPR